MNDYGILNWKVGGASTSAHYLDLTVSIENGVLVTKTYQKPTNLHQYITPNLAHPPWMMEGIVLSMLTTYYFQNTYLQGRLLESRNSILQKSKAQTIEQG